MVYIKDCGRKGSTVSKYHTVYRVSCTTCTTNLLHDVFIDINYCSDMFRQQLSVTFRELAGLSTCAAYGSRCVGGRDSTLQDPNITIIFKIIRVYYSHSKIPGFISSKEMFQHRCLDIENYINV